MGDGGVIGGGSGKGLGRQQTARCLGGVSTIGAEFRQHRRVIFWTYNDCYPVVILGSGPDHRRATHIDVLYGGVPVGLLCDSLFKRVKIDHEKIDISDGVGLLGAVVGRIIPDSQKSAMNFGVQGLYATIHDFGKARN